MFDTKLRSALLTICCVLLSGQYTFARTGQSFANDDCKILSFGKDSSLDATLGTSGGHCVYGGDGPVGIKHVDIGENFCLVRGKTSTLISKVDPQVLLPDRKWSFWYHSLGTKLSSHWSGDVPGQAQVILRVTPDYRITMIKELAFVPGLNKAGRFDTSDETHTRFMKSINECLAVISGSQMPRFPFCASAELQLNEQFDNEFQDITKQIKRSQPYFERKQSIENAIWHDLRDHGMESGPADVKAQEEVNAWMTRPASILQGEQDRLLRLRAKHAPDVKAVERWTLQPLRSASFVTTFGADRNMHAVIPNLSLLAGIPKDEKSQWIARICTILDSGTLNGASDILRSELPLQFHQRFIPRDVVHFMHLKPGVPGFEEFDGCTARMRFCTPKTSEAAAASLRRFLDANRFLEAQLLAGAIVYDYDHFRLTVHDVDRLTSAVEELSKKGTLMLTP
jgi:hypothetical protein